jgi:hypothetical protein
MDLVVQSRGKRGVFVDAVNMRHNDISPVRTKSQPEIGKWGVHPTFDGWSQGCYVSNLRLSRLSRMRSCGLGFS